MRSDSCLKRSSGGMRRREAGCEDGRRDAKTGGEDGMRRRDAKMGCEDGRRDAKKASVQVGERKFNAETQRNAEKEEKPDEVQLRRQVHSQVQLGNEEKEEKPDEAGASRTRAFPSRSLGTRGKRREARRSRSFEDKGVPKPELGNEGKPDEAGASRTRAFPSRSLGTRGKLGRSLNGFPAIKPVGHLARCFGTLPKHRFQEERTASNSPVIPFCSTIIST